MKKRGKNIKAVIDKEEIAENWCFVCKDGGDLRICDYKKCLKAYHSYCVEEDNPFPESEKDWACAWHKCFICHKSSCLHCYTCTIAVCRRCLSATDFLRVKGQYGFCSSCLTLALLIEEGKDCDSNGDKVDFRDRETFEGLFMEYYVIIKEQQGFELGDLVGKHSTKTEKILDSSSEEIDEEHQTSDYDSAESVRKCRRTYKGKRYRTPKSGNWISTKSNKRYRTTKSGNWISTKSNKNDFIGWGSTPLIDFLSSIGRSTDEKLSQLNVTSIVHDYAKENKLLHPEKKKMIVCDDRLRSLFRRKTLSKNRVYDLLETHFAENHEESQEDEVGYDTEDDNAGVPNEHKIKRKLGVEIKSPREDLADNVPLSCFASIVVENIKLVYLRRSLLLEMLKQPELFEKKVVGCFVRLKSDPYDYRSRNSYQLIQVKGVGRVPIDQSNMEATLLLSAMPKEVSISLLSDDDFTKEECGDLREKILAGQLERPTVEDLQQKANILHVDLTNHWITKQLALLRNLIDRANEKGWRRELFEYLERKRRLQNPSEVSKLLNNIPRVLPDLEELIPNCEDIANGMSIEKDSPKSILQCNSSITNDVLKGHRESEEKTRHCNTSRESKQLVNSKAEDDNVRIQKPSKPSGEMTHNEAEGELLEITSQERSSSNKASETALIELLSDDENSNVSKATNVDENQNRNDLERKVWCLETPNVKMKTYSLALLRQKRGR